MKKMLSISSISLFKVTDDDSFKPKSFLQKNKAFFFALQHYVGQLNNL